MKFILITILLSLSLSSQAQVNIHGENVISKGDVNEKVSSKTNIPVETVGIILKEVGKRIG